MSVWVWAHVCVCSLTQRERVCVGGGPMGPQVCLARMRTGEVRKSTCYLSGNESEVSIRAGRVAVKGWRCVWLCARLRACSSPCLVTGEHWRSENVREKGEEEKTESRASHEGEGSVTWRGGVRCGSRCRRRRSLCTCTCLCHLTRFGRCEGCRRHPAACGGWTGRWSPSPLFPRHA